MIRRNFLKMLGLGTVSAPLAAKATVDGIVGEQAGLSAARALGLNAYQPYVGEVEGPDRAAQWAGAADYLKIFGLPEVWEREYRDEAKYVSFLDPDIACKKSWSMCVKIQHQRERNFQRRIEAIHNQSWVIKKRTALEKLTGFKWPW